MKLDIVTIFPEIFKSPIKSGILAIAKKKALLDIRVHDLRDFTSDKHGQVDDVPYGGGPGMVMKAQPFFEAVKALSGEAEIKPKVVLFSPRGARFDHNLAARMAGEKHLILLCPRYEGVDERVIDHLADDLISMGDYVLSGAEYPAMLFSDAVVRLIPGVLGDEDSLLEESFTSGLLEYPHYTRPNEYMGYPVPEVLLSGDHERIRRWRRGKMLQITKEKRPDLFKELFLSEEDKELLKKSDKEA